MSLPAAGWFPDPQDGTRLRWWDGATWGDDTRPVPGFVEQQVRPVVPAVPSGPNFSVHASTGALEARTWAYGGSTRKFCLFACMSVLFPVAALAANPYGVCSAVGLVAGFVGVVKPRGTGGWRIAGRSVSASAMVLAVATGIITANEVLHLF